MLMATTAPMIKPKAMPRMLPPLRYQPMMPPPTAPPVPCISAALPGSPVTSAADELRVGRSRWLAMMPIPGRYRPRPQR